MAKGIIAAGHDLTVDAAEQILSDGGNAFDAAVAAFYAACIAEPVLASPGGGGFLLARPANKNTLLYDGFVQTPSRRDTDALDFIPIEANFGEVSQQFHMGLGSIAVPGIVRGMFQVYADLCSRPMRELVVPALSFARQGVTINAFQAYILDIISPIFLHHRKTREQYAGNHKGTGLLTSGDLYYPDRLADTLETLALEGERLFYEGEIAASIADACQSSGGLVSLDDLKHYQCIKRTPLSFKYRDAQVMTNPAPSSGGVLIAFALKLLERLDLSSMAPGSYEQLLNLILAMDMTQQARLDHVRGQAALERLLDEALLKQYGDDIRQRARAWRGTTHISIIDGQGNMAGLTLSNGEGCGYMLADTGIMLNNMLGEQDLNPHGFFNWQVDQRMTSMMAPSLMLFDDGRHVMTGSGGSNRIRTALMQVMINLVDYGMPIDQAVAAPRLHYENGVLNMETANDAVPKNAAPKNAEIIERLRSGFPDCQVWSDRNLFFGGAHSVMQQGRDFYGAGDERRGGVCRLVI